MFADINLNLWLSWVLYQTDKTTSRRRDKCDFFEAENDENLEIMKINPLEVNEFNQLVQKLTS